MWPNIIQGKRILKVSDIIPMFNVCRDKFMIMRKNKNGRFESLVLQIKRDTRNEIQTQTNSRHLCQYIRYDSFYGNIAMFVHKKHKTVVLMVARGVGGL